MNKPALPLVSRVYSFLLIAVIGLFSLGELQRLQLSSTIAVRLHELVLILWIFSSFITHRKGWRRVIRSFFEKKYHMAHVFIGWVSVGVVSAVVTHTAPPSTWLYLARLVLYLLSMVALRLTAPQSSSQHRLLWVFGGLGVVWLGLLQYLFIPDTRMLKFLGWDDHYFRLIGPLLDPNFTGLILLLTIYYLWSVSVLKKWVKVGVSGVLLLGILLTFSRATFLSLIITGGILLTQRVPRKKLLPLLCGIILTLLGAFIALPKPTGEGVRIFRTYSITQRLQSSQRALNQMAPHHWVVGRGLFVPFTNQVSPLATQPNHAQFPDNICVFLLAETGIVGLLLAGVLGWRFTNYLSSRDSWLWAGWLAILIHSQFNHTLLQPFVLLFFLVGLTSLGTKRHG